jgi:hypothetical protein
MALTRVLGHRWTLHTLAIILMILMTPGALVLVSGYSPCPDTVCSSPGEMISYGPNPGLVLLLYLPCLILSLIVYAVFVWAVWRTAQRKLSH